jgi:hypothetical protein
MKPILWQLPDLGEEPSTRFALPRVIYLFDDEAPVSVGADRAGLRIEKDEDPSVLLLSLRGALPTEGRREARTAMGDFLNALLRQSVERRLGAPLEPEP